MTLYATERIDDAVSLTRSLLVPVDAWLWVKLAFVVAFVGLGSGGGGSVSWVTNVPSTASTGGQIPGVDFQFEGVTLPENALAIALVLLAVLLVFGLVFAFVGAVMEFVLVRALADRAVSVRQSFRRYARQGLSLFGFRLLLGILGTVLIGGTAVALFWSEISTALAGDPVSIDLASVAVRAALVGLVGLVVGTPLALAHGITTVFVVPVMLRRECGVLAGWRRFWPTLTGQLTQYVVFLLVSFALHVATTIAAGIVTGILAVVLLIPFAAIGLALGLGALASGTITTATLLALVALALVYGAVLTVVGAFVYVPVRAFHRYYALLVLGDTDEELDVVAEIRPPLEDGFEPAAGT